jgi:hypothetical protein
MNSFIQYIAKIYLSFKLHVVYQPRKQNIAGQSWKLSTWKLSLSLPVVGSRLSRWFWERMSTYNNHVSDWRWCRPWNCNVEMVVIVVQGQKYWVLIIEFKYYIKEEVWLDSTGNRIHDLPKKKLKKRRDWKDKTWTHRWL